VILRAECLSYEFQSWSGCVEQSHLTHLNKIVAALKNQLCAEDLLVRGFRFFGRKKRRSRKNMLIKNLWALTARAGLSDK